MHTIRLISGTSRELMTNKHYTLNILEQEIRLLANECNKRINLVFVNLCPLHHQSIKVPHVVHNARVTRKILFQQTLLGPVLNELHSFS